MTFFHDLYTQLRSLPRIIRLFYVSDIFFAFAQAIFATLFNLHVQLALGSVLAGAFMALPQNFTNVILAERFGFGSESIATVLTVGGVLGWLGSMAVPWTSRRLGDMRAYARVVGLQGIVLAYLGLAATVPSFMPAFWLRGVLGSMQMSLFSAFAMGVTADAERATANSYAMVGRNLGAAMAAKGFGVALAGQSYLLASRRSGDLRPGPCSHDHRGLPQHNSPGSAD